jgi:hypothetical protein
MRLLVDLAGVCTEDELEAATHEVMRRRIAQPERTLRYIAHERFARSSGIAALRKILEELRNGVSESDLEMLASRLLQRYGLPRPRRQFRFRAAGREVRFDLAYPDERVAIELDGYAWHSTPDHLRKANARQNATSFSHWLVLHFTWQDIRDRPLEVVLTVAEALGLRPRSWRKFTKVGSR